VRRGNRGDPREFRVFVIASRQLLVDSRYFDADLRPRPFGPRRAVHSIQGDELVSIPKTMLTDFVGRLSPAKLQLLNRTLIISLDLED
jgi:mRNA interferase MazF